MGLHTFIGQYLEGKMYGVLVVEKEGELSLIHISEPTRHSAISRMPSSA